jgi:hypothetical protein
MKKSEIAHIHMYDATVIPQTVSGTRIALALLRRMADSARNIKEKTGGKNSHLIVREHSFIIHDFTFDTKKL